ncbi:hypothetical protein GWN91_02200, partial [Candidatus Saccharibacteria bacterium]|nr:hypothetical protein [Candidatus Saccharibacteria bacterium]NIV72571.1 hypothetical protein [Calditrichia bacterium]NIW78581.1 hypothetical protein [Calditrichia bacterium]
EKVEREIESFNRLSQQLFAHFNQKSQQQIATAKWQMEISDKKIICYLENEQYRGELSETTAKLIDNLKTALLGTSYGVYYEKGIIEIRSK